MKNTNNLNLIRLFFSQCSFNRLCYKKNKKKKDTAVQTDR